MKTDILLQAYLTTFGLIAAIGAQNAHVLRMGLTRQHVPAIVAFCAASDALLVGAGLLGMGALVDRFPLAVTVLTWLGAAFLLLYGLRSLRAAFAPQALNAGGGGQIGLRTALTLTFVLTWFNPHALLDTLVLLGALGARHDAEGRLVFWIGSLAASSTWFVLLGFGARHLAPLFARPLSWRLLDGTVGIGMGALAVSLVRG